MDAGRLIYDRPASGSWNMAVDDALLESVQSDAAACLRFYRWSPATLSLGYFQAFAEQPPWLSQQRLAVVRRRTGGGAILHDREVTYSLALPIRSRFSEAARNLVFTVHQALCRALAGWGVSAAMCGKSGKNPHDIPEPFLCFQRRAEEDVIVGQHKIAGSAQRRRHGATLLHGSVLLDASPHTPQLPGINDLSPRPVGFGALTEAWQSELAGALGICFVESGLSAPERQLVQEIETSRFASPEWTKKR